MALLLIEVSIFIFSQKFWMKRVQILVPEVKVDPTQTVKVNPRMKMVSKDLLTM